MPNTTIKCGKPRRANRYVRALCPGGNHNIRKSAEKCDDCGADLCELCGSDEHYVADGHDLNNPRYWGV